MNRMRNKITLIIFIVILSSVAVAEAVIEGEGVIGSTDIIDLSVSEELNEIVMPGFDVVTTEEIQENYILPIQSPTKIELNMTKAELFVGKTLKLKVTGTKTKVYWSSSNKKVAKVDQKGKVSAIKAGKAKIIAKVGKKKLTCTVIVRKPIKGDISWIMNKEFDKVEKRFPDKFRLFESDSNHDYYTNDYVLLDVDDHWGEIWEISLLTDAKKGIGKYTLFGVYPGMGYSKAVRLIKKHGFERNDYYSDYYLESDEEMFGSGPRYVYITIKNGCIDLISYIHE